LAHNSIFSHSRWRIAATICALAAAASLAGCGKKQETQAVVGQVIAHVGPDDVTQQEVDNELRLANVPADKRTDELVKAALSRVVERKYLMQQAVAAKLDREPTVHLDVLRSRENVLAAAYMQRDLSTKMSSISKNEIDSYTQAHPTQFAARRLFHIEQITIQPPKDFEALAAATKDMKTLDQIAAKLNELNINFSRGMGTLDGAAIPPEMLKALDAKKADDVFFTRSRTAASYFKVLSVEPQPLTGDDAERFARRELYNEIRQKSSQEMADAAVGSSKYEGDYERIMKAPTPTPAPAIEAPAGEAPTGEKPAAETPTAEKPKGEAEKTGDQPKQ
jgi:EpsD family peptidyl-prolyl cis-trans isomerase